MGGEFKRKPIGRTENSRSLRARTEPRPADHDGCIEAQGDVRMAGMLPDKAGQLSALFRVDHASRARIVTRAQQRYGNAFVQRALAGSPVFSQPDDELAQRLRAASSGGSELDPDARAQLEAGLGADLQGVRVHTDAEADYLARSVNAAAFTSGHDIFFRGGLHDPSSPEGLRLLAHEATHVVQQGSGRSHATQEVLEVSQPEDASEQEAETLAGQLIAGEKASVHVAQQASIARDVLDSIAGGVSDAWDWTKGAASDVYSGMKENAGYVREGVALAEEGIDWLGGQASSGARWMADQTQGIPVLEHVTGFGAELVDQGAQFGGGILKGATGLVGGAVGMVANPVDTVIGMERLAEHVTIPGVPNPFKAAHGLYDVLANDQDVGEVANRVFNPMAAMEEDANFMGGMAHGILEPYGKSVDQGKYAEAAGRAVFDIGSLLLTGGSGAAAKGATGAGRAAAIGGETAQVARGLETAGMAGEAARGLEAVGATGEFTRGMGVAGMADEAARGLEAAGMADEAARSLEAAGTAGEATRTMEVGASSREVVQSTEAAIDRGATALESRPIEFAEASPAAMESVMPAQADLPLSEMPLSQPASGAALETSAEAAASSYEIPSNRLASARRQAREGAISDLRESVDSGIYSPQAMYTADRYTPDVLVEMAEGGRPPADMEFSHMYSAAEYPEYAHQSGLGVLTDYKDHRLGHHGGDTTVPLHGSPRDPAWESSWGAQEVDATTATGREYLGMTGEEEVLSVEQQLARDYPELFE